MEQSHLLIVPVDHINVDSLVLKLRLRVYTKLNIGIHDGSVNDEYGRPSSRKFLKDSDTPFM